MIIESNQDENAALTMKLEILNYKRTVLSAGGTIYLVMVCLSRRRLYHVRDPDRVACVLKAVPKLIDDDLLC